MKLTSKYRTHTCGEVRASHVGQTVTLSGWILRKRDHGGIAFIDLRDNYGVTQIVFSGPKALELQNLRVESVITVVGSVVKRSSEMVNSKIETGEVEVLAQDFTLISQSDVLPFLIAEDDNAPEATRLKYRFLELRREKLHKNILLRSRAINEIRNIMHDLGFVEFQTPILTSSSPEGARDFLVPSRFHPGKFFALPQAPQQFKQLLMTSGFDRYFQIAPCFRDEDPRADRSPGEFYQCDLEMAFAEQEDVFEVGEALLTRLFTALSPNKTTDARFPRIKYREAMATYGSDKPDLRNPLRIEDVSEVFKNTQFKVFQNELSKGGAIRAIALPVNEIPSRKYFDETVDFFTKASGQGVAYLVFDGSGLKGSIQKFVTEDEAKALTSLLSLGNPSVVFLGAGVDNIILPAMGKLRTKLGIDFNLIEKDVFKFCWIVDFPMYDRDEKTGELVFFHNPFSMPQGGMEALTTKNPLDIYAYQYDIVCNGYELSSGAIRNHLPEIMYKAFEIVGYPKEHVDEKFGALMKAFHFGAPPHGGMAPGIDRMVMLLAGEEAIREVIAFPMAQTVEDLLMGAPSEVPPRSLLDVHIQVKLPPEKKVSNS